MGKLEVEQFALKGTGANEAKMVFINRVKHLPLYGCCVLTVSVKGKINANKMWIGIGKRGIGIWEPYTKDPAAFWPFDQITTAAATKDTFSITTGSLIKPEKYTFFGPEAASINQVYNAYKEAAENASVLNRRNII
jgi:hypothetical protein